MSNMKTIKSLMNLVEELRKLDPEMQLQTVQVLLAVAHAGDAGVPMTNLADNLGISQASASRNVAALGNKLNRHKQPGLGLLESKEDPADYRRKIVKVTAKGNRMIERLVEIIS